MEVTEAEGADASAGLATFLSESPVTTHHLSVEFMMARSPTSVRAWWSPSDRPAAVPIPRNEVARPHGDPAALESIATRIVAESRPRRIAGEIRAATHFAAEVASASSANLRVERVEQLMRLATQEMPREATGLARPAVVSDVDLLAGWMNDFDRETGSEPDEDFNLLLVRHYVEAEKLFVWALHGEPVASTARFANLHGVEELKFVYTPPEQRGHGFGAGIVAHVARAVTRDRRECVLRADLMKPGPQRLYRKVGLTPVDQHISIST